MSTDRLSYCLCYARHQPRVLQYANRGVARKGRADIFEFVVAVELDFPSKIFKLRNDTGLDNTDGPFIDTGLRLGPRRSGSAFIPALQMIKKAFTCPPLKR